MTTSSIGSYNLVPVGTWPQSDTANGTSSLPHNSSNCISGNSAAVFTSPTSDLTSIPVGPPPPRSTMAIQPWGGIFYPTPHTQSGPRGANNYVHQSYVPTLPPSASQPSFQAGLTSVPNLTAGNYTIPADGNLGDRIDSSQHFANCGYYDSTYIQSNSRMPNTGYQYPAYTEYEYLAYMQSRTILESIEQNGQTLQDFMNYPSYQNESVSGANVNQETTAVIPRSSSTFDANKFDGNYGPQSYAHY